MAPDGGVCELTRQNSEKLQESFTDGEGKTTRLTEITNAEGEHYRLEYDKAGQLIAETDFTGRTLRYRYDVAGRCIRTTFRYDTLPRLVETKNDDATVTYEYNDANRVTAETLNGRRTEYAYDPDRDFVTQRTTGGLTERFTHGLMGELKAWQLNDHAPLTFEHDLCGQEISRRSDAGFYQQLGYTPTGMLTQQRAGSQVEPDARHKNIQRQWLYDQADNLTMISDSLRGTSFNILTANDQINHATWTGSGTTPMSEERFSYDKNLNLTRRQTWINEVLESETHQQQQHGRVVSREHQGWRHSRFRINPETGKPEEGKFVKMVNAHGITWKYDINGRLHAFTRYRR